MSKLFIAASLVAAASLPVLIGGSVRAAPTETPSEPEQTINAIGADVSARTQWFGDAIDHLFDSSAPPPEAPPAAHKKRHHEER